MALILDKHIITRGVSGPVVSALDSGSKGPGSSPTRGMSLYP